MRNFKAIDVYDKSQEARDEFLKLKKAGRITLLCERCGCKSEKQLVLYRKVWDKICEKFRTEKEVVQKFNRNIFLCPKCMEELNGKKFEFYQLGMMVNKGYRKPIPCNEWYYERIKEEEK